MSHLGHQGVTYSGHKTSPKVDPLRCGDLQVVISLTRTIDHVERESRLTCKKTFDRYSHPDERNPILQSFALAVPERISTSV
jgi:hypothetical protein